MNQVVKENALSYAYFTSQIVEKKRNHIAGPCYNNIFYKHVRFYRSFARKLSWHSDVCCYDVIFVVINLIFYGSEAMKKGWHCKTKSFFSFTHLPYRFFKNSDDPLHTSLPCDIIAIRSPR